MHWLALPKHRLLPRPIEKYALKTVEADEDNRIAGRLLTLALRLVAQRYRWNSTYEFGFPAVFALLLSESPEHQQMGMQRCRTLWQAFQKGEELSSSNSWVKQCMHNLYWPNNAYIMSMLIRLAERDFQSLSMLQRDSLLTYFTGLVTTAVAEDGMNVLRTGEGVSHQHWLTAKQRWLSLTSSTLLQDYARKTPPSSTTSKAAAAKKLTAELFQPKATQGSLGQQLMREMSGASYTSRSSDSWASIALANQALLHTDGDCIGAMKLACIIAGFWGVRRYQRGGCRNGLHSDRCE